MRRKLLMIAAAAALGALVTAAPAAIAQQAAAQSQAAAEYTAADARAVLNARLAALKTVVELTPDQEKLWPPVEAAIREIVQAAAARREKREAAGEPKSFLDVLTQIANGEEARAQALRKFVAAAKPLVASLTPEQQRRIPAFLSMHDMPGRTQPSGEIWLFEEEE